MTMTYEQLLNHIIADGIAEVTERYAEDAPKREGAIAGFNACRGKSPAQLEALYYEHAHVTVARLLDKATNVDAYWHARLAELQVEWVCNVVSAAPGMTPVLSHLPTVRGALKYAAIVGVEGALPGATRL